MLKTKITPLYERLSHDDELNGESNFISNQKSMLEDYARRNGFPNPTHFTDGSGDTGGNSRPATFPRRKSGWPPHRNAPGNWKS